MNLPPKIRAVKKYQSQAMCSFRERRFKSRLAMSAGDIVDGRHFPARDADLSLAQPVEWFLFSFILIVAWKILDQVPERRDAERAKGLRPGRADFTQIVDWK